MTTSLPQAFVKNFLGNSPNWYKQLIITFLIINPIVFYLSPYVAGWLLVIEFILTLVMALKCYPLQPGGLLIIEAVAIGMTSIDHVMHEIESNIEVLLLLIFMVAGIYFMKQLLLFLFTKLLINVRSKTRLSLAFVSASAVLSAFLDALTVIAVIISVAVGFYSIYHKVASGKDFSAKHDHTEDSKIEPLSQQQLEDFRAFLRNLLMHAAIGTALGGVTTMVGEPQNLIIAAKADWGFLEFFLRMSAVTIPVLFCGLLTTFALEQTKTFGYGAKLPDKVRKILTDYDKYMDAKQTKLDVAKYYIQAAIAVWLIIALALHLATVGLIGLSIIILTTSMCGITDEHQIGHAFQESLPFTALLCVFFAVVAVIIDQQLFVPVIEWVLTFEGRSQLAVFYLANGFLSMVSDNVFVGSIYITEVKEAWLTGQITRDQFDLLAIAINTGTNLPSVATPNGQAAFLFLLTSTISPLVRLSYGRMVFMALPYTLVLTSVGLIFTWYFLPEATDLFYQINLIEHHSAAPGLTESGGH